MAKGRQKPVFDIDINNVYYELHNVAMENSKAEADKAGCVILNTGVNEKGKSYFGSGRYDVECVLDPDNEKYPYNAEDARRDPAKFRTKCFAALRKYVEFFLSDAAKQMKETQLIEVRTEKRDMRSKPVSEGLKENCRKSLVEALFAEAKPAEPDPEQSEKDAEEERRSELAKPAEDTSGAGGDLVGYRWRYDNIVAGRPPVDWKVSGARWAKNAASNVAKGIGWVWGVAGGAASKLADMIGGFTVHTLAGDAKVSAKGAVDAVKKAGDIAGKAATAVGKGVAAVAKAATRYIDKDEFADAVHRNIQKDYPNSDVTDVRANLSQSLENDLRQQKKLTSDIKRRLESVKYPITILVSRGSKDYPNFDVKTIADQVVKAYGGWLKRLAASDVGRITASGVAQNIVRVDQVKPIYKIKSSYDQELKRQIIRYTHNAQNTKDPSKGKTLSEADINASVRGILASLFEEKTLTARQMRDEIKQKLRDPKYAPHLDVVFQGFKEDSGTVTDKDVELEVDNKTDPALAAMLKSLDGAGSGRISRKADFIDAIKAALEPVETEPPPDDASDSEKEKAEAARKKAVDERIEWLNRLFDSYDGARLDRIYVSFSELFKIVDRVSGTVSKGLDADAKEYDMYIYFDPRIRDLEDEENGGRR